MADNDSREPSEPDRRAGAAEAAVGHEIPVIFNVSVFSVFFWIIFGLSIIYGYRLWWDAPIDPSFVPFMCVGFAVIVAFTIVLTLRYATGEIEFEAPGFKFKGASGPILLWVVCFLAIIFGFYLVGIAEIFKVGSHNRLPLPDVSNRNVVIAPSPTAPAAPAKSGIP